MFFIRKLHILGRLIVLEWPYLPLSQGVGYSILNLNAARDRHTEALAAVLHVPKPDEKVEKCSDQCFKEARFNETETKTLKRIVMVGDSCYDGLTGFGH